MGDDPEVKPEQVPPAAAPEKGWLHGTWRKVSLTLLAAVVAFTSGLYELGHKAIDNVENRSTVSHLNTLALRAMERGEYQEASGYLQTASSIMPSSFETIERSSALKTLQLAEAKYKAGEALPYDIVEQLEEVGLSTDEANFCIAVCTYSRGGTAEIRRTACAYLDNVSDNDPRLAILKRARRAGQVLLPRISEETDAKPRLALVNEVSGLLADVKKRLHGHVVVESGFFRSKKDETTFVRGMNRECEIMSSLIESEKLKLAHSLGNSLSAADEQKVVTNLKNAQALIPANSPLAASIGDQLVHYSSQAEEEKPGAATDKLDQLRLEAIAERRRGDWTSARKKLGDIITAAGNTDSPALYKTYFSLGLIAEYQEHRLDAADDYYGKAEAMRSRLKAADPSLPNTYGYFWYKRARDTHDTELRQQYADKAREQFKKALAIDPGYSKSINSLDGLQRLLASDHAAAPPS
jgi:tetratricopeptide (TPR) repeat protein